MATGLREKPSQIIQFVVVQSATGNWDVRESGFDKPLAEFAEENLATEYALRMAESKPAWKVDTYDACGAMLATFNSEDDAMPRPQIR